MTQIDQDTSLSKITLPDIELIATELGFDDVAITEAAIAEDDKESYIQFLKENRHGSLAYLENQARLDPSNLLPGAKSAILFATFYKKEALPFVPKKGLIASYARGRDYHIILKKRLKRFCEQFSKMTGGKCKPFCDTAPILEKALACRSGIAFFGKNSLLIHRKFGTFFLLSGALTDVKLPWTIAQTREDRCRKCSLCVAACPTGALDTPFQIDAPLCLSYQTIESKEVIREDLARKNPGVLFGCDICQDVCPHNRTKPLATHPDFKQTISPYLDANDLRNMKDEDLFGLPLQRKRRLGLLKNCEALGFDS